MPNKENTLRLRNWCFTLFTEDEPLSDEQGQYNAPLELLERSSRLLSTDDDNSIRYAVWQLELCPTSKRLHYQGYIEFNTSKRMGGVKRILGNRVHLEPRRGSRSEAIDYCKKEDSRIAGPWEQGECDIRPGQRNDLGELSSSIQMGMRLPDLCETYPSLYIKYRRGIEGLLGVASSRRSSRWRDLSVYIYYGEAGTGKTKKAIEEAEEDFYILDQSERLWFDGYFGQRTLIIDDFYGWIKHGQILRILDGHPYRCEIKGGFVPAEWTRVVITSNKHPGEWYPSHRWETDRALQRRITEIIHFE